MSSIQQSALTRMAAIATLLIVVAAAVGSAGLGRPALAVNDYLFVGSWGDEVGIFRAPTALAVGNGRVHVCNSDDGKLAVLDLAGRPLMAVGGNGYQDGQFTWLTAVAVDDDDGTIYAVDAIVGRVQLFSPDGVFLGKWGTAGTEQGMLNRPLGMAFDVGGNLLVADTYNDRIQRFSPSGTYLQHWGVHGAGPGQFDLPRGIAVGLGGAIYVADTDNHRIQRFDASGNFQDQWGAEGLDEGEFRFPTHIAADPITGEVFVTDYGNHRVQVFSAIGTFRRAWGGYGQGDGDLALPYGIGVDGVGNVYVSEYGNHRVQKLRPDGSWLASWGRSSADDGQFSQPEKIAVDGSGAVYVADTRTNRIQKFTQDGAFLARWGTVGGEPAQFSTAGPVAADVDGSLYVIDRADFQVDKFDPSGAWVISWGGGGTGTGEFEEPAGIAVGGGHVYVTDRSLQRVTRYTTGGDWELQWGSAGCDPNQFGSPCGIAVDVGRNRVYVSDCGCGRIALYDLAGGYLNEEWPVGYYVDLSVDGEGNVFGVDGFAHQVIKVSPEGEVLASLGARGSKDGEFSVPQGIAAGANGIVYVVDTGNHRINRYAADYPAPDPIYGLTRNGSFEESPGLIRWTYGGALPVTVVPSAREGSLGARLGQPVPAAPRPREEGWLYQTVHIPDGWARPVLAFDYRIYANDTMDYSDLEVTLTQSDGAWLARILRDGFQSCDDPPLAPPEGFDLGWRRTRYDLSAFKGRTVRVRFAVRNLHADYSYGIWAVVDNVRLVDAGPVGSVRNYLPMVTGGRPGCDVVPGR